MRESITWGILTTALVAALWASPAVAAEGQGPAFGSSKITTELVAIQGENDTDDYTASLIEGELLSVSVGAAKKSELLPGLQVFDPDCVDRTPELKVKGGGKKVSFKKLPVDKTGVWTVRISGGGDTQGEYTVAFKLKKQKAISLKKQALDSSETDHTFEGVEGAQATITVKYSKKGAPVSIVSLQDPAGDDVESPTKAADDFVLKGTKLTLKKAPLSVGDGTYALRVGAPTGAAEYSVKIAVVPQDRPKGKRRIPASEPFLEPRANALRGVAAVAVQLAGLNLGDDDLRVRVFFDGNEATVTGGASNGTSITVVPPAGIDGSTVSVSVVDEFGQAFTRPAYFEYVPLPTITALTDDADQPVLGGDVGGGLPVRLRGTNFEAGNTVRFGAFNAPTPQFVDATELLVTTPAASAGTQTLILTDNFGRQVAAAFDFEFKAPAEINTSPGAAYSPPVGRAVGGTTVTITGAGFEPTDQLFFDGAQIGSTFMSATTRTFVTPARAPGEYAIELEDRFGTMFVGPNFRVKAVPIVTSVQVVSGSTTGGTTIGIGGDARLRIIGANFEGGDTVEFDGADIAPATFTDTRIDFDVPASAPGTVNVGVRDLLGDAVTLPNAVTLIGFDDVTATVSPGGGALDDLGAVDAAIGDLDVDGVVDDIVIVGTRSAGTRQEYARLLNGTGAGLLNDNTAVSMPAYGADPIYGGFGGNAVAIGDLDGGSGPEIVISGDHYYNNTTYTYYDGVRVLVNDGSGNMTFSAALSPAPYVYYLAAPVYAYDQYGTGYQLTYGVYAPSPSQESGGIAIGDLDGDGDNEVVVANAAASYAYFYYDPAYVDFTQQPYYISYDDAQNSGYYGQYYLSATRVLNNEGGLVDRTLAAFGGPAGAGQSLSPGNFARGVALGDVDGVNGLDITITWDEPTTVSLYGAYTLYNYGSSYDTGKIATRVFLNDGNGLFSDETYNWLPASADPEFWQGDALAVVDIVGTAALDLVLLHEKAPALGTSALRILRNDGVGTGFTDVTAAVLPALPANESFGGDSLAVTDADGDGDLDILIGSSTARSDGSGGTLPSTRLLLNNGGGLFSYGAGFLEGPSVDSGETEFLLLGTLSGNTEQSLFLGTETAPGTSPASEKFRVFLWDE